MSDGNTTQNHNSIEYISDSFVCKILLDSMKAAIAKEPEANAFEDLGRATLRIVHDLKNQLNGLKLYATFLRKRLDRPESSLEERETVAKLIAGLDRGARDLSALVRYAQPFQLRRQPETDLRKIIIGAANDVVHRVSGPLHEPLTCNIEADCLIGTFDPNVLAEAFNALTHDALGSSSQGPPTLSIHARRIETETSFEALVEWRGMRPHAQESAFEGGSAYTGFAAKVIAAHEGRLEFTLDTIRVSLPLTK